MKHVLPPLLLIFFFLCVVGTEYSFALIPDEVVVIANSRANHSVKLAKYYIKRRNIPEENLIIIRSTWKEVMDRESYTDDIAEPVRKKLAHLMSKKRVRCLVTMYGIPLKIRRVPLGFEDKNKISQLNKQLKQAQNNLKNSPENEKNKIKEQVNLLKSKIKKNKQNDSLAAVDSELALVLNENYPLNGWLPNPYFLGFQGRNLLLKRDTVFMVSRLDGPDAGTVRRMVDDSIHTEQQGLKGIAYFDARWPKPAKEKKLSGYALYDESIHEAAQLLDTDNKMEVRLNDKKELFAPNECPDTALYCGWYSLGKYKDAFTWNKGAIGYHIASSECSTLKKKNSQVWCKRMLEKGVAATIGPVYEPYVQAFPLPSIFFSKLREGYLTLGEVYLISLPYLSWQMVLIGDPLYLPFQPDQ